MIYVLFYKSNRYYKGPFCMHVNKNVLFWVYSIHKNVKWISQMYILDVKDILYKMQLY